MSELIHDIKASHDFDTDMFYTTQDMWCIMEGAKIYVPRGFLTDGASVPKMFQGLFPKFGEYYQAAVFHDYLCEYLTIYKDNKPVKITRVDAENYFKAIMKHLGVPQWKRTILFGAVRINSNVKSIIYPSATLTKREYEDKIRAKLDALEN